MKSNIIFLSIIFVQKYYATAKNTDATVAIETRIDLLKRELFEEMEQMQPAALSDQYADMYEYVDNSNQPITPISIYDKRKLKDRFKLPELKSTTTEKFIASDSSTASVEREKPLRSKIRKPYPKEGHKPLEIFYRKMIFDDEERNKPQKWVHCSDLITPYFNGYKDNITNPKRLDDYNISIKRLAQLLSINVTDFSRDDIRSILYEISNEELRIYQWDISAVRAIMNVIIRDGSHDFKGLKYGLKRLFKNWKLDTSHVGVFLKQSRIFRPPCVQVSEYGGSTKTTGGVRYSKTTKQANSDDDEDC